MTYPINLLRFLTVNWIWDDPVLFGIKNFEKAADPPKRGSTCNFRTFHFIYVLLPWVTSVQYCGGCSVQWGISVVLWRRGTISASEDVPSCRGCSVFWGVGGIIHQYCEGIPSSSVEDFYYCGRAPSLLWGILSALWRIFSTVGGYHQ